MAQVKVVGNVDTSDLVKRLNPNNPHHASTYMKLKLKLAEGKRRKLEIEYAKLPAHSKKLGIQLRKAELKRELNAL